MFWTPMAQAFKPGPARIVSIFFCSLFRVRSAKQKEGGGGELESLSQT
jgi:hypothetical protein